MPRYFADMMYTGTRYHGWQVQPGAVTVQGELERRLQQLYSPEISIVGSGRTDAGVHARQQYFHVDLPEPTDADQLCYKLNCMLPGDIAIRSIFPVADDTHARFSATRRAYEYQISPVKDAFLENRVWHLHPPLNLEAMNEAAAFLIGRQDFTSFSRVKTDVNHFECTIFEAHWERKNDLIVFNVSANRFLRGMVRALVGTLSQVGLGKMRPAEFEYVIRAMDRKAAGASAPPQGLFLTEVHYPEGLLTSNAQ